LGRDSFWGVVVFLLSGILGLIVLNGVREPLFPLLSGLFGASGLVMSLVNKFEVPVQFDTDIVNLPKMSLFGSIFSGVFAGSIVTLFPGLGPSQAAALAQFKRIKPLNFLVMVGALGTVDVLISLVTFFSIGKARNGAVVVIEQLLGDISKPVLFSLIAVACVAVGFSVIAALSASKWYAFFVERVDYWLLSSAIIIILLAMSVIISGWLGLLVFLTATFAGLIAPLTRVSRSHAMGCLLLPTLFLLCPIAL
jgi:putative membrane protein